MTSLTQKSQVTIPKMVRMVLGLKPGDEVEFTIDNDTAVLHKKAKKLPFEKWRGIIKNYSTKKFMDEFR